MAQVVDSSGDVDDNALMRDFGNTLMIPGAMMEHFLQEQLDIHIDEDSEYQFQEIGEYRLGPIVLRNGRQVDFIDVFRYWSRNRVSKTIPVRDLRACKSLINP